MIFENIEYIWYNFCYRVWSIILVNTYYEDELKNSLKSTSMKLLVLASYAQSGVSAGNEDILGARNGIRQTSQLVAETYTCGKLRNRIKPTMWRIAMSSVAWLEWY